MNIEEVRTYCLSKPGVSEDFPFGDEVLVFRVLDKLFVLSSLERSPLSINLKCDPEKALELREEYEEVTPGYHMNKKHWNTINLEGDVPSNALREWIDDSYDLVVAKLRKKDREALKAMPT